jgi:hypothetical protein
MEDKKDQLKSPLLGNDDHEPAFDSVSSSGTKRGACCAHDSAKFTSWPLIMLGAASFLFSLVYTLWMQISHKENTRDSGEALGFYPQLLLFGWMFGFNLLIWRRYSIPSRQLLCLNDDALNPGEMFTYIGIASIPYSIGYLIFAIGYVEVKYLSLNMSAIGLLFLTLPGPVPFKSARWKFLSSMRDCLYASFGLIPVEFWHTFVTDGMTSATVLLWEMEYSFCCISSLFYKNGISTTTYLTSGENCGEWCGHGSWHDYVLQPLVYSIPFWLRLLQEIHRRNWWNALKYVSCVMLVYSSGIHSAESIWNPVANDSFAWTPWRVVWLLTAIYKTSYCYWWDMRHDFGIWQPGYGYFGLRDPSTLSFNPGTYHAAMCIDLVGRISWTFTMSPHLLSRRWGLLMALVEILRRGMWNVFRLEHRMVQVVAEEMKDTGAEVHLDEGVELTELTMRKAEAATRHDEDTPPTSKRSQSSMSQNTSD